jgi:integrase
MSDASSHGPSSRRPVYSGKRRIPGLYERRRADGSTAYEARYRRNGSTPKLVVLDATTKSDAIAELQALRVDGRRGDPLRTRSLVPTLEEVGESWIAALKLRVGHRDPSKRFSPRTVALYEERLARHVLPTLGTIAIDELSVVDLRRLIDKLGRKLAPSTVTQIVSVISGLLRFAVRERLVERNVVRDLDRDDRPGVARQSEPRYLAADEVALLLSKLSDVFRPIATICAYAGLRISETLGLTWADVDLNAKTISVRRQLDDDRTVRNEVKSKASGATVPMLPAVERELRAHRSRQAGVDLRLVKRDALVFTTTRGKPQSRRNALRAVHAAGDAAGLNDDGLEPVGLHDLRHSLVAGALDSGVTLAEAAVLARHANAKVTGAIYAGVSEKAKAQIASKLVDAGFGS